MVYKVIITIPALDDLDRAFNWMKLYSPLDAEKWLELMHDRTATLATFPERCPVAPESKNSEHTLRHLIVGKDIGTFRIIYRIDGETVLILHVQRSAQDFAEDL